MAKLEIRTLGGVTSMQKMGNMITPILCSQMLLSVNSQLACMES